MKNDLSNYRRSYEKGKLIEDKIPKSPYDLFDIWFRLADESSTVEEANAMNLATVDSNSAPKSRIVLLKSYTDKGLKFYSNYRSEKARHLEQNPQCCISFFWPSLEKQIIIRGKAEKLEEKESEAYFHSRPKGSQLGAVVSKQSTVIPSRKYLEEGLLKLEKKYEKKEVPKPVYWGGYIVFAESFEFWQGRKNRLHDRIKYTLENEIWKKERLAP